MAERGLAYKDPWKEFVTYPGTNYSKLMAPAFWSDFVRCYPEVKENLTAEGVVKPLAMKVVEVKTYS